MAQTVQRGGADHLVRREGGAPFVEVQIRGQDGRRALVALGDQVAEILVLGRAQRFNPKSLISSSDILVFWPGTGSDAHKGAHRIRKKSSAYVSTGPNFWRQWNVIYCSDIDNLKFSPIVTNRRNTRLGAIF